MRSRRLGTVLPTLATLMVLLAIGGCGDSGSGEETRPSGGFALLDLTLDGEPDPETVGVLAAEHSGDLREAGIGLTVGTPFGPERPLQYVVGDSADIVVSYLPQVVLAGAKGAPVVAFGSLTSHPTMAMIWLPNSGIDSVAGLKGKTIAIPGLPFQRDFLAAALERSGLSLNEVKVIVGGFGLTTLLEEGRADAIFGGSGNVEGAELEARGLSPVVTPAADLGIPDYDELVFVTRRDRIERNPDLYQRFVELATAGTDTAEEDPAMGQEAIVAQYFGEPPPPGLRAGLDATLPLLSEDGEIDPARTQNLIDWMHGEGMIERRPPVADVLFEG